MLINLSTSWVGYVLFRSCLAKVLLLSLWSKFFTISVEDPYSEKHLPVFRPHSLTSFYLPEPYPGSLFASDWSNGTQGNRVVIWLHYNWHSIPLLCRCGIWIMYCCADVGLGSLGVCFWGECFWCSPWQLKRLKIVDKQNINYSFEK